MDHEHDLRAAAIDLVETRIWLRCSHLSTFDEELFWSSRLATSVAIPGSLLFAVPVIQQWRVLPNETENERLISLER